MEPEQRLQGPLVFISHVHEDAAIAMAIRNWIDDALLGSVRFFVSSDNRSLPPGTDWPREMKVALAEASIVLVLVSPASADRHWIYFEAGAAYVREVPTVPVCVAGAEISELQPPLSLLQAIELPDSEASERLLGLVARHAGLRMPRHVEQLDLPSVEYESPRGRERLMSDGTRDQVEGLRGMPDLLGASAFFTDSIPSLRDRLQRAKTVAINGMTLATTSDNLWGTFKQCIIDEATVRVLIVDPHHVARELAAQRFHKHQDPEKVLRESTHALDNFQSLKEFDPSGQFFEVRLFPAVPPYGIWVIDGDSPEAEIWVELYCFRDEPEAAFHLLPERDGRWFEYFRRQFETMWGAGREWN